MSSNGVLSKSSHEFDSIRFDLFVSHEFLVKFRDFASMSASCKNYLGTLLRMKHNSMELGKKHVSVIGCIMYYVQLSNNAIFDDDRQSKLVHHIRLQPQILKMEVSLGMCACLEER